MYENELKLLNFAFKNRFNKKIKELKKLYQATIDADRVINFHSKCDNIPNTLVLIKSEGNRRFGGFTSIPWTSPIEQEFKDDPNAFLFSLDKQKIYPYIKKDKDKKVIAIGPCKDIGPCFGEYDIYVEDHFIENKGLYTCEDNSDAYYNFHEDRTALSESNSNAILAVELEVFQVIFE